MNQSAFVILKTTEFILERFSQAYFDFERLYESPEEDTRKICQRGRILEAHGSFKWT